MTMTAQDMPTLESVGHYLYSQPMALPESLIQAILDEVALRAEPESLRAWCHLFGKVWGDRAHDEFSACEDLPSLNEAVNAFLSRNQWGWVRMEETQTGLRVQHSGAPLLAYSVRQHLAWSCGLLEGFYDTVFKQLGADESMRVLVESVSGDGLSINLQLSA